MNKIIINKLSQEVFENLKMKDTNKAKLNCEEIIRLDPNNIFALNNLGNLFALKNQYNEALSLFNRVLTIKPKYSLTLINKGHCLQKLQKYSEALSFYQKAVKINPNINNIYFSLGNCLLELKRYDEALINYKKALKVTPNFYPAYTNQGNCLRYLNKLDEAIISYKKAIEIKSDLVNPSINLSQLQLLLGDYNEGWKNYEWRKKLDKKDYNFLIFDKKKEWLGDKDLNGKTIFISKEQGLGDYIFFCRYLPLIKKLGANIILDTPKKLIPLINSMSINYQYMNNSNQIFFDYHCSIGSLPLAFKTEIKNIPNETPYLFTPRENKDYWRKKINKDKINIGIKWAGSESLLNKKNRSADLNIIKKIFSLPYEFHSLEVEYSRDDEQQLKKIKNLHSHKNEILGFENTAGLIEAMDLVISVDTSIANLCGAINKTCYVLLPFMPNFRWLLDRKDSPWYPSLKLYRQRKENGWDNIIENVKKDLLSLNHKN
jgi:tetratricopeptide (TPR) repeat protein